MCIRDRSYCEASGGWVSAAVPVAGPPAETNNNVVDGGGSTNWKFERPQIRAAATVYDNVIRITFEDSSGTPMLIENDNNEISAAVSAAAATSTDGSIWLNSSSEIKFTGAFTDAECTTSTNGAGDLDTFYIQTTKTTWNTDATGTSSGDGLSTDRSGNVRNIIPDLVLLKGILFSADGKTLVKNYNKNGFPVFDATTDECRPALVAVTAGRHNHDSTVTQAYDGHNYFHLRYSEPVNIGTGADFQIGAGSPADNVRSQTTFGAGEHGGDLTSTSSTATLEGYFTYPVSKAMSRGSRDATPTANSLYRNSPENPDGDHGLTIYIAGWSYLSGSDRLWPGWVSNIENPVGKTVSAVSNAYITDANGNAVEPASDPYNKAAVTIAAGAIQPTEDTAGWDVTPPYFSTYIGESYEIMTDIDLVTQRINRLEFFIQDNFATEDDAWNPETDHPDTRLNHGVRDITLNYPNTEEATDIDEYLAFKIAEEGQETLVNTYNLPGLETNVNNDIFGEINTRDDSYFALTLTTDHDWGVVSSLIISYDYTSAYITDLAGNIMPSTPSEGIAAIERIPPFIDLTLAAVGKSRVYVRFSEPVYSDPTGSTKIVPGDFTFSHGSITGIEPITYGSDNIGIKEAWVKLSVTITENMAVEGYLAAKEGEVYDRIKNRMSYTRRHRITDIGIGTVEPVWASDGVQSEDVTSGGAMYDFTGGGKLTDRDITLEASILADNHYNKPLTLFYDVDPPDSVMETELSGGKFWLPIQITGFNPKKNDEARGIFPFRQNSRGNIRDFLIPSADPEIEPGKTVQFIFRFGDLFCARITDPDDPRTLVPWSFSIGTIKAQRANVTILNNVINPLNGEKTILTYELPEAGTVTVQVFTLDGKVVRILQRGRQGAGTYTYSWDGKNIGGKVVARGIYFIRVVGPGIDEYRKVMVVK